MGKKNNKKSSTTATPLKKLDPQKRQKITEAVEELFKCCTQINQCAPSKSTCDEEEYNKLYNIVQKIRELEKDMSLQFDERELHIEPFLQWLSDNGAVINNVEIHNYNNEGLGLRTKADITEKTEVLRIPNIVMMSETTAHKSYLGNLMDKDPILKHMSNISLALHVLAEKINPASFWQPYLKILPSSYSTILYFTPEELKVLNCSYQYEEACKMFKNIARQYSYFYKVFYINSEYKSFPLREHFTYDSYRWAVSTVMTRQNRIPETLPGSSSQLALIPAWDFANHRDGYLSTDYSNCGEIVCFANKTFKPEEQFTIYYGQRTNAEFFLHSGFVYPDNTNDLLGIELGIAPKAALYEDKINLLNALGLPKSGRYPLLKGTQPISQELLAFSRVFSMNDKDCLEKWLKDETKASLCEEKCSIEDSIEKRALSFLKIRIELLLRKYAIDNANFDELSESEKVIKSLVISEKDILQNGLKYLVTNLEKYNSS